MRPTLALLAAFALLSVGLTGCLGDGDDPEPAGASFAAANNSTSLENVTNDDGSAAMGQDLGHMPHLHDYWKDRERVTLMDEDVTVDAPTAAFFTFLNVFRGTPGAGGAFVRLPEGQIVFEGTGKLEFTATWTDATVTGMGISYRTPADPQFTKPVELKSGAPLALDITPEQTDMPHAKTSRWQFLLSPAQAGQVIAGKFHVKVDIVRVRDVTVFPGHPELFNGAHTLVLFDGAGASSQENVAGRIANQAQGKPDDDSVQSEKVVPMETRSMTANLTVKAASSDMGKAAEVYFLVKPADRNGYAGLQPIAVDEATQTYQFAWLVDMAQTDSPYAEASDWRFNVFVTTDQAGFETGLGGVKVDYDLQVVAYDDVVPDAQDLEFDRR